MIVIINYGLGNLGSIANMLKKIGKKCIITSDLNAIKIAEKLILPGVGSFDSGMKNLREYNLLETLNYKVKTNKTPILGICLGMQLMCRKSEEGLSEGLGWFDANIVKFRSESGLKVPHMNWSYTEPIRLSPLLENFNPEHRFYHVHSYHIQGRPAESLLESYYQKFKFVSAIERDNIIGVQFHPEKSHKYGMHLLANFCNNY